MSATPAPPTSLEPPVLLLAMPQVLDPYFHKSVVLLVHHDEEGSLGFIVNRPTDLRVAETLSGMELAWSGPQEAAVHFGGPVQKQLGTVLFGDAEEGDASGTEHAVAIGPGLWMSQHVGDLTALALQPPHDFRLLLGYAGWGAGQLVEEILRNDWLTAPLRRDLVFGDATEDTWERALASVGIDPASLPSWTTATSDDEAAN